MWYSCTALLDKRCESVLLVVDESFFSGRTGVFIIISWISSFVTRQLPTAIHGHDFLNRWHCFYSTCMFLLCRFLYFALQLHQRLHECGIVCIPHGSMALWTSGRSISPCDLIPFSVMFDVLLLSLANSQNLTCHGQNLLSSPPTNADQLWSRRRRCESNESADAQIPKDRYSHQRPQYSPWPSRNESN